MRVLSLPAPGIPPGGGHEGEGPRRRHQVDFGREHSWSLSLPSQHVELIPPATED